MLCCQKKSAFHLLVLKLVCIHCWPYSKLIFSFLSLFTNSLAWSYFHEVLWFWSISCSSVSLPCSGVLSHPVLKGCGWETNNWLGMALHWKWAGSKVVRLVYGVCESLICAYTLSAIIHCQLGNTKPPAPVAPLSSRVVLAVCLKYCCCHSYFIRGLSSVWCMFVAVYNLWHWGVLFCAEVRSL